MILELLDEVCTYLSSKHADDWADLEEIIRIFRKCGLTDAETKLVLDFLDKYFLEHEDCGRKVRLIRSLYNLYRGD